MLGGYLVHDVGGVIGATVVHHQHLRRIVLRLGKGYHLRQRRRQAALLVVGRDDDRQ